MKKKLYVSQFDDPYLQKNFQTIGDIFSGNPFLKGEWQFLEVQIKASGANTKIPHKLSFTPKDAILLSSTGGTITFNYDNFGATYFEVAATVSTSPMTIRVLVGRYTEDTVSV